MSPDFHVRSLENAKLCKAGAAARRVIPSLGFQLLVGLGFRLDDSSLPRQIRRGLSVNPAPPLVLLETVTRHRPIDCTGRDKPQFSHTPPNTRHD